MFDGSPLNSAPWRLSGLVLGVLLNDPAELEALGATVHAAPYKAPPRQPVLYIKPRNTLLRHDEPCVLPAGAAALHCGVSLGLLLGQPLCRARVEDALQAVVGLLLVLDLYRPHESFYRPNVPLRALDGSCRLSPPLPWRPAVAGPDPDKVELSVQVDGVPGPVWNTTSSVRRSARLLADISAFMTLRPGDVVMTGVRHGAPLLHAGQTAQALAEGVGALRVRVEAGALAAQTGGEG